MSDTTDEPSGFAAYAERIRANRELEPPPERVQARRLAAAMRDVIEHLVATKAPADVLEAAAAKLEAVVASLDGFPRGHTFAGFADGSFAEASNSGDTRAFFDSSPIMGLANPLAPPLQLQAVDGKVVGTARYGTAYEGPPGCVHGGFIAAAFDEVLGMAQSLGGRPGMTGTLTIRYRRPTPLNADLRFEAFFDRIEGRKIFTNGRLLYEGTVTAEAEAVFITVDFGKIADLARERGGADGEA